MLLSSPVSPGGVVSSEQCNISPVSTLLYSDPARCDPCVRAEGADFQKVLSCLQRRGSHTALAGACKWQDVPQIRGLLISMFRSSYINV